MPQEAQQSLFKELAAGLPDQQRAEFFKTLHEASISQNDVELARLLRALQLYKAYYESIPAEIRQIAAEIERICKEVEIFSRDAHQSSDASARLAGQVIQEAERIREDYTQIHQQIEKSMIQSSESLASRITELLRAGIEKSLLLPLQSQLDKFAGSSEAFGKAITQSNKAVTVLRENVRIIRRAHLWTYGLCGIVIVCVLIFVSWLFFHQFYSDQMEQKRTVLVEQVEKNRAVLLELAKSHRTLELIQDPSHPNRKLLIMKDAFGWQLAGKYGVIEFSR